MLLPLSAAQQLAMRRNVEKLVAFRLGAAQAQAALPLLAAAAAPAPQQLAAVRDEIVRLLSHVLSEESVAPWLAEFVDGRFSLYPPCGTQACCGNPP